MSLQGTAQAVAAGVSSITIVGTFPTTYSVGITARWATTWRVTAKSTTQFTVDFGAPAPVGGSTFDWTAGTAVSPDSSGTQAVTAAAVSVTIAGTFGANYQVALGPAWMTAVDRITKTPTAFTVQFSVPVPVGNSTLDWIAVVPVNTTTAIVPTTPIASATVSLAAGAVTTTIAFAGSLPTVYEITIAPGWVSDYVISNKTSAGFTVTFTTPVPAAGADFDYIIYGPAIGQVSLQDYLTELQDLLHDPNTRFWSQTPQMTRYINQAIRRRDLDSGSNRQTISFTLTSGTDTYTFSQVNGRIFDVYAITLLFGNVRQVLDNPSLVELTALGYRYAQGFTGWTAAWAKSSPSTVVFAPAPSTAFVTEWDVALFALPLLNLTDLDPLPFPYTQPVAFYAAYLAKMNEKNYDEAQMFLEQYMEQLGVATNGRVGRVPNAYTGLGSPMRRY